MMYEQQWLRTAKEQQTKELRKASSFLAKIWQVRQERPRKRMANNKTELIHCDNAYIIYAVAYLQLQATGYFFFFDVCPATNTVQWHAEYTMADTVFAEINVHPEISAHQTWWFFRGGSTQNRWALMGDFSKGGVHKTDGLWWVSFQRGEYTKPTGFDGWFFKGGSTWNRRALMGDFQRGEYTKPMGCDGVWNFFYCL